MYEIADWVECVVLSGRPEYKRGDLKSTLSQENLEDSDLLEQQTWEELIVRAKLFGEKWPLELDGSRLRLREEYNPLIEMYQFLCLLGLGQAENVDRVLFEELVVDAFSGYFGSNVLRVGHPASEGMSKSFRSRIESYSEQSGMSRLEVHEPPYSHDKDLGLDVVSWMSSADGRGGYLHFLVQCATGRNWQSKLDDINLQEWNSHLVWAVPPVRVFCVPNVIRLAHEQWIRTTRRAGLIIDRPRLMEIAGGVCLREPTRLRLRSRIEELSAA